jgi:hypothetical protein
MRISLLEEREDFDEILKETLEKSSFFKNCKNEKGEKYFVNKYLNFIASNSLSKDVFQTLINEYSSSLIWWKKGLQSVYVKLATSKFFRSFFAQRSITLSEDFKEYLILGGNHRLRLFYGELKDSLVILKSGENLKFIKNDIAIRTEHDLTYAPKVFDSGDDWLREEYFNGIPLNRLESKERIEKLTNQIVKSHSEQLLLPSSKSTPLKEYIQFIQKEISDLINNKRLIVNNDVVILIQKVCNLLFEKLSNHNVEMSWSHGDFQAANILVRDKYYKVIDWEASNKRFYLYDVFTLLSKIRSGISLTEAIENLKRVNEKINRVNSENEDEITLLLIEELRFHINEDFSENFYSSGKKTEKLCQSIISYIHE